MPKYERDNIASMAGYSWGEQPDDEHTIKLNTNENPYPPSPNVEKTLAGLRSDSLRRYPNPTAKPLRDLIARTHGIAADQVVVTHAGDEALRLALTTFVDPQACFGMAEPSYSLYPVLAAIQDATITRVDLEADWTLPGDFTAQLNKAGCRLTCLVNPHAPSGSLLSVTELRNVAENLDGVLLIDEAYADFIDPSLNHSAVSLIDKLDNVLILRTFSKGYSLAGLRLGYLMGSTSLIEPIINKTRDSYNIDHISQQLGYAALEDQDYAAQTWQDIRAERERLDRSLGQLGLVSPSSQANFLLASIPVDAKLKAQEIYVALKDKGILVRYFDAPRLRDKLRISVGTEVENNALIDCLTDLLT